MATMKILMSNPRQVKADFGKPGMLFIDVDSQSISERRLKIRQLIRILGIKAKFIRYDKTKHGWHIVISTPHKFTPLETIAIQAILGSDRVREAMNLRRLKNGCYRNLLWEHKK